MGFWSEASPEVRSDLLDKVGSTIIARSADIGRLLAREEGKTVVVKRPRARGPRGPKRPTEANEASA